MKPALFTFLQLLVLFKTKTDICGHIVTPMMHWAIWYSSRVSAVRPGARSPPTARQPARRQRSASASLYLSCRVVQSGGSLRGSPEAPSVRIWIFFLTDRAGFSPRLHAAPLSVTWKTSCHLWPFCSVAGGGETDCSIIYVQMLSAVAEVEMKLR